MGCVNTKAEGSGGTDSTYASAVDPGAVQVEVAGVGSAETEASEQETAGFQNWSEMESAEEKTYLKDELGDASIEQILEKAFPTKLERAKSDFSSIGFWKKKWATLPGDAPGFKLEAPWTLDQARAFYRYLSKPSELEAGVPAVSRKCVYSVLIDAFKMLEDSANENGALQQVPPPQDAQHKLFVCGDTHGQLQDVLWIFELHGLPSAENVYLFNGDIADRGSNAIEIFMLLFAFKLAEPRSIYINRGNHEQRDLNERPFANGGGFAWEVRDKYPHDEHLIEFFQRMFVLFPIAAIVGQWAFVIHGGLFRQPEVAAAPNRTTAQPRAGYTPVGPPHPTLSRT